MKSNKWLTYTLVILLTVVILAAVGGAGFRMGAMQSASFAKLTDERPAQFLPFRHGMDGEFSRMGRGEFPHGFGRDRGGNRGGFFPHIFGLLHLIVLGALAWFGYTLIKNSGWRLVKVNAPVTAQPSEAAAGDEKKETE